MLPCCRPGRLDACPLCQLPSGTQLGELPAGLCLQVQREAEMSSMERAGKQVQKERAALARLPEVAQGHALQVGRPEQERLGWVAQQGRHPLQSPAALHCGILLVHRSSHAC